MAQRFGGKIVTDGLVLCLDAHDAKSYAGEPATNLIPLASGGDGNSRFTTTNAWGTYNTNQYNSNQYFSIGTISSVSNNIVTTSSNHPFRTFDAVRPQTTGGGVSYGTNYFIKKISDTTFSIHAYNNSQNGSQGYVRSDGYHQVHESIATDTRVSINSTSFPTMWHGPAHLPNTCHVKEIVEGGGYAKGTNCMRIHVTRTVGVNGGMAYSVYTTVTQGDTIAVSYWARCSPNLSSRSFTYTTYFGVGNSAFSTAKTLTPEWQLITYTWTASANYNFIQYFFPAADSQPYYVDMADLQVEVGKSYSTPYTPPSSPRSATNGWVDRSGNSNSGTLVNGTNTGVSHYRNGEVIMPVSASYLDFDGTNDYVVVTNGMNSLVGTNATTFAAWVYIDTVTSSFDGIIANKVNGAEGIALLVSNTQKIFFQYDSTSGNYSIDGGSNVPTAEWTYIVGTYDTVAGYKTYMNGELNDSEADAGKSISSSGDMTINIGAQRNSSGNPGSYFPGRIAKVEIYNKALTAAEVLSNYNATKPRFGL